MGASPSTSERADDEDARKPQPHSEHDQHPQQVSREEEEEEAVRANTPQEGGAGADQDDDEAQVDGDVLCDAALARGGVLVRFALHQEDYLRLKESNVDGPSLTTFFFSEDGPDAESSTVGLLLRLREEPGHMMRGGRWFIRWAFGSLEQARNGELSPFVQFAGFVREGATVFSLRRPRPGGSPDEQPGEGDAEPVDDEADGSRESDDTNVVARIRIIGSPSYPGMVRSRPPLVEVLELRGIPPAIKSAAKVS
jgi:hypothetical protein